MSANKLAKASRKVFLESPAKYRAVGNLAMTSLFNHFDSTVGAATGSTDAVRNAWRASVVSIFTSRVSAH
jgi:hypothetical protein